MRSLYLATCPDHRQPHAARCSYNLLTSLLPARAVRPTPPIAMARASVVNPSDIDPILLEESIRGPGAGQASLSTSSSRTHC